MYGKQKLPLIPGFVVHKPKENYHLPQCWSKLEGSDFLVEKKHADNNWILNDGKILCFKAYFRQDLSDSPSYQIRNVKILYYIEDDSLQVIEPRTDNSGIPQGCIVMRQKIPCALPNHYDFISFHDLNVGKQVKIFDRVYIITDCDGFTRTFLSRAGIEVPFLRIETPKDPVHVTREQMNVTSKPKKPQADEKKLEKFLQYDKCCLKFDAYWDDRNSLCGDIHKLIVYYYLADDTIQINEIKKNEKPKILYKRLKLPKSTDDVLIFDQKYNCVLNVIGGDFMSARCMPDRNAKGNIIIDRYTAEDLRIGKEINVFGRSVILTDCDKFTQEYYRQKYGIEDFTPIEQPKDDRWVPKIAVERILPPWNGFGSFEDSEANCISIQPKAPQRDMKKFLELDNSNLRFKAEIIALTDDNSEREFVITYYLSDDTVSVFEIGKNIEASSRDFMKRCKTYLSINNSYSDELCTSQMFYIGATVNLNGFQFHIFDADEFTLKYMESHQSDYPVANISSILSKIKNALKPKCKEFFAQFVGAALQTETVSDSERLLICYDTTAMALRELVGEKITEHEILTFIRYFSAGQASKKSNNLDRLCIQSMVQMALNNDLWNDVQTIEEFIYDANPDKHNVFIPPKKLRTMIKGCRVPIKDILIDDMVSVLNKDSKGNIDVNDFLYFIDVNKSRAPPIQPINPYDENDRKSFKSITRPNLVDWSSIIEELGVDEIIKQESERKRFPI